MPHQPPSTRFLLIAIVICAVATAAGVGLVVYTLITLAR